MSPESPIAPSVKMLALMTELVLRGFGLGTAVAVVIASALLLF